MNINRLLDTGQRLLDRLQVAFEQRDPNVSAWHEHVAVEVEAWHAEMWDYVSTIEANPQLAAGEEDLGRLINIVCEMANLMSR